MKRMESPRRGLAVALLALLVGTGVACAGKLSDTPLSNARETPEALARDALVALAARDGEALDALRVTREEYEELLWPVLPDGEYVPFEFVWSLTGPRSRKGRQEVMGEYGGLPLELVKVDLGEKTERYDEFTLYQDARMTVRRTDTGKEGMIPLMDVLVEMGGGWKFLNFGENL